MTDEPDDEGAEVYQNFKALLIDLYGEDEAQLKLEQLVWGEGGDPIRELIDGPVTIDGREIIAGGGLLPMIEIERLQVGPWPDMPMKMNLHLSDFVYVGSTYPPPPLNRLRMRTKGRRAKAKARALRRR